jgi:hypothetical protein
MDVQDPGTGTRRQDPLRFAIMGCGAWLEAWQARCVEHLLASGDACLTLRIVLREHNGSSTSRERSVGKGGRHRLFRWYRKHCLRPAATRPTPPTGAIAQVRLLVCSASGRNESACNLSDTDLRTIEQVDLDFILYFDASALGGQIVKAARYGVWAFRHGDPARYSGETPGFWEIYHGDPVSCAVLLRLRDDGGAGAVLQQGCLKTIHHSHARSLSALYFESAEWPAQVCRNIRNGRSDVLHAPVAPARVPPEHPPTNRQMIRFLTKIMGNLIDEMKNTFFRHGLWNIGIVEQPIHAFLDPEIVDAEANTATKLSCPLSPISAERGGMRGLAQPTSPHSNPLPEGEGTSPHPGAVPNSPYSTNSRSSCKSPPTSFPRKRECSPAVAGFKSFWTPALAGVTVFFEFCKSLSRCGAELHSSDGHAERRRGISVHTLSRCLAPPDLDQRCEMIATHYEIQYLASNRNSLFLADPFGLVRNGRLTVLCEDLDYRSCKGVISSFELEGSPRRGFGRVQPQPVMEFATHASYPYLLEHQGEIYCIPETARLREVSLYRAHPFPTHWSRVGTLLADVAALDSTVFQYQGLWWLTCTDKDRGAHSKLFIWVAADLFGPWTPHASNPVKIDVRSARPAGTPFVHQGVLYRPAQDCSRTYGGGVVIHRVTRLTPTEFSEEPVAVIRPDATGDYPDGVHTLAAAGNLTLIDGKRLVFKGAEFRRALRRELAKVGLFRRPGSASVHRPG